MGCLKQQTQHSLHSKLTCMLSSHSGSYCPDDIDQNAQKHVHDGHGYLRSQPSRQQSLALLKRTRLTRLGAKAIKNTIIGQSPGFPFVILGSRPHESHESLSSTGRLAQSQYIPRPAHASDGFGFNPVGAVSDELLLKSLR